MSNPGSTDQDLLLLLSEALCPPPERPTEGEREALRTRVIAARTARRAIPVITWWRSHPTVLRFAAAAAAVTAAVGAYLATNPLPQPVRSAVYAMGLPVDSPQLVSARHGVANLESAVATRNAQKIVTAQHDLEHQLTHLDHHDLAEVSPHANQAIAAANQCLEEESHHSGHGTEEHSSTGASTGTSTGTGEHTQPATLTPGSTTVTTTQTAPATEGGHDSTEPSIHD